VRPQLARQSRRVFPENHPITAAFAGRVRRDQPAGVAMPLRRNVRDVADETLGHHHSRHLVELAVAPLEPGLNTCFGRSSANARSAWTSSGLNTSGGSQKTCFAGRQSVSCDGECVKAESRSPPRRCPYAQQLPIVLVGRGFVPLPQRPSFRLASSVSHRAAHRQPGKPDMWCSRYVPCAPCRWRRKPPGRSPRSRPSQPRPRSQIAAGQIVIVMDV